MTDTKQLREAYGLSLDDELLKGCVMLSEWCGFLVRESDLAFVNMARKQLVFCMALSNVATRVPEGHFPGGISCTLFKGF